MPDWPNRLGEIRAQLAERLGVRGPTFDARLRRAGRRLPRSEAEFPARAEEMARHPQLAPRADPRVVERAHGRIGGHRQGIDPAFLRCNRRLDAAAGLGLCPLVTFALVVTVLRWRGTV